MITPRYMLPVALGVALAACGSVEEAGRDQDRAPEAAPPRTFEFLTDTVDAVEGPPGLVGHDETTEEGIGWTVQLGAFRSPHNANISQSVARARLELPVISEYDPAASLYCIRAGFFPSREEAGRFRDSIVRRYPSDYADCWIVRVKRNR